MTAGSWWEHNLRGLRRLDPLLAERMAALPASSEHLQVMRAAGGLPTARAQTADGAWVQVHSRVDPIKEARQFAAAADLGREEAYALMGLGLGYPAFAFLERVPRGRWVLLVETREDLFRTALEQLDWSPIWNRPATVIFVGTDYGRFLDLANTMLWAAQAQSVTVARHPMSHRINGALYQRMAEELHRAVSRRQVELSTLLVHAEQLEENAIANLLEFVDAAAAADFSNRFRDVPAYLIGAGPSLNEAIPHLREVQDRALLIAVDKCAKLLLREGIRPHLTSLLDMTAATQPFYEGLSAEEAPVLVFDPDAYHETVAAYPGPRVSFETVVPWPRWAAAATRPRGLLDKGISVAHTAFNFLVPTRARPIVFVGVDLAFPNNTTHAEGVVMNWGGRVDPQDPTLVSVPSVTGGQVLTNLAFQTFVTLFEILIAKHDVQVINTSPAGARIRGTQEAPIREVVARVRFDDARPAERVRAVLAQVPPGDRGRLRAAIDQLVEELRTIQRLATDAARPIQRIARLDPTLPGDQKEYSRLARRLNTMRAQLLDQTTALAVLQRNVAAESLVAAHWERQLEDLPRADVKGRSDLERRRMALFFAAYHRAVEFVLPRLEAMRERLG